MQHEDQEVRLGQAGGDHRGSGRPEAAAGTGHQGQGDPGEQVKDAGVRVREVAGAPDPEPRPQFPRVPREHPGERHEREGPRTFSRSKWESVQSG